MFRFTMKPLSGSHSQYLAKITHSVQCEYMEVVQTLLVLWLHTMTCEACVLCTVFLFYIHLVRVHSETHLLNQRKCKYTTGLKKQWIWRLSIETALLPNV
jgi:hypothetical protein